MMRPEDDHPKVDDLLVRMVVPIRSQPIVGVGGVIFRQWLPMSAEDRIVVMGGGLELALWFDFSSLDYPRGEVPPRCVNVSAHRLNVEARIHDLGEEFLDYVLAVSNEPKPEGYPHSDRYKKLGEKLYSFAMNCVNRLISFVRVEKGQYWLEEYEADPARMASAESKSVSKKGVLALGYGHPTSLSDRLDRRPVGPGPTIHPGPEARRPAR